jgi:hypothetical protein
MILSQLREYQATKPRAAVLKVVLNRFPKNPYFCFEEARRLLELRQAYMHDNAILKLLATVKQSAALPEYERFRGLAEQAEQLEKSIRSPMDLFDFFFNRS